MAFVSGSPAGEQSNVLPTLFDQIPAGVALYDRSLRLLRCNQTPLWQDGEIGAEAIGAALTISSEPGEGTRVDVRWPASQPAEEE